MIDFNGCSDTVEITVNEPSAITPIDSLLNASCHNDCDGYISLAVSGATPGYTHSWSNGTTDTLISNLCPGLYSDTITDGLGCRDTFTYVILNPDSLKAIISDTTDVSCSYSSDGQAIVTPTGGTPGFSYNWYDAGGDLDSVASGLLTGTYHVSVTDSKGCLDTGEVVINAPAAIAIEKDSVPSTCSGICDGVAIISVTGGTGSYTYDWFENGNIDNDSLYNICADTFSVKVADINGCLDTAHVIVTQPITILASIVDTIDVNCHQGSDGGGVVTGLGGTIPYTYWWDDASNQTNDTATGLLAGTYRVAVIDLNGCSDTTEIIISEPAAWNHVKDSTQVSCYAYCDGQITVTPGGGTAPYTHNWTTGSTSATVINLCEGIYTDTITDVRGCKDTLLTYIFHPDSLQVRPNVISNVLCYGDSTATAYGLGLGGTSPYSYEWGDPIIYLGDTLSNMIADTYKVVITDKFGCTDTNEVIFDSPTEFKTSITDTVHANCICNASAIVTPVGGVGGYTYLWNDLETQTDSLAIGLCTGSYEVLVADANGCVDTSFVTIKDTSLFTISITDTTHIDCNSRCNGEAIVTPSLGKIPYTYSWSDPLLTTDSTVTGVCGGVINVTVTDNEGCVRFENVMINEPGSLIVKPMFTNPSCNGDTNGIAWADVTGGTVPYLHSWDTKSVNDTVYNIGIGTYTDTISDANGCLDTVSVTLIEPAILASRLDSVKISCNGAGDGIVWSETTGGTTPYTYQWNDESNARTDSVIGLTPGFYTAIVTDINGCSDTDSVAITEPLLLVSSITDTSHVSCFCTGVAIVTPLGGTAPYTYLWNDPLNQTDSTAIGLCAGNYTVNITDFNGCTDTSYVIIRDTSNFITSIVDTNMVSCNMMCNGSALARAENGVQPYSFTWNDLESTTDSLVNGLCAGSYTVNISDAIGCTHNLNVTITEPTAISIVLVDTNISCNGICNGSIEAFITGGTSPYSIDWNDPSLSVDTTYLDSLCVGPIEIEVNDVNGCVLIEKDTITEPADLVVFVNPFNHVSCFGSNDAELSTLPTGGTSPYAYSWSSGESSKKISGKGPGTYNVLITDTNNCSDFSSIVIIEPNVLASSIKDVEHLLCGGTATGSATVTVTGGTRPYSYNWFNAPGSQIDSTAINLPAGTYNVEIIDANGCNDSSEVIITEPILFTNSITNSTSTSCTVCDGTAFVTSVGGTRPYSYSWYDAPGAQTDSLALSLCAAVYHVEIIDGNGCADTIQHVTIGPGGLTAAILDTTMVSCSGLCDAGAVVTGVAGAAPYIYTWDDSSITLNDTVQNLCVGLYSVLVEDVNGCLATAQVTITEPDALVASLLDTTSTGCASPCSGEASVTTIGGTGNYTYSWNDWSSQTTSTATDLCAAQYTVTVTDASGCSDTTVAFVTGPASLTVAIDSIVDIKCNGVCDGKAAITAQGGVGAYTYLWNDPFLTTDSVITGLCSGITIGQVTDGNGCLAFTNVNIIEPAELLVSIGDSSDIVCNGFSEGWATVLYSGGTAPYDIVWNDGRTQTTDTVKDLVAGTYTVTVIDAKGCSGQASVTLSEPITITASTSDLQHVLCTGFCIGQASLTVSGGTIGGGYSYLWEDGQTSPGGINLCSGFQTYQVTDGVGCTLTDSVEILDQNNFTVAFSGTSVSCNGDCNGTITATASGGTIPYTHSWTQGSTANDLASLCPGYYTDTVSDANGCFLVDSFEVEEPAVFITTITDSLNLKCFGSCDGKAFAQGNGGTSPYQFTWYNSSGSQVNDTAYSLCATTYYVLGEDANGCQLEDTISLTQPSKINVLLDAQTDASCSGICDGVATVSANGGSGSLLFTWEDGSNLLSRTALCADEYTVVIIDDSLCVDSVVINLRQPDSLLASIIDTSHIVCANVCDGAATVGESGGTAPYTYNWYDAGNVKSSTINNQCIGIYHAEVTDVMGCKDTAEVTINDFSLLTVSVDITNISCNGVCDGVAFAAAVGGVEPYTYSWQSGESTDSIKDLCDGNYILTVTDFENCSAGASGMVIEPPVLKSSIIDSANLDCFGVCDGYATISPSGGTSPYTYVWNDDLNQTSYTATGLCAETYKAVIIDNNGCKDSINVYIDEPDSIFTTMLESQANCTNLADGSIDLLVSGGTANYSYSWTSANGYVSSNEDIENLLIGAYELTIIDENGCTHLDTATITEVNIINANAGDDITICNEDSVLLVGTGGMLYSWSEGGSSDSIYVDPSITTEYILTVFNNGCADTDTVIVNVNGLPDVVAFTTDNLILENTTAQLTASGAGMGAVYDWTPPIGLNDPTIRTPIVTATEGVTYFVTGTDLNGCSDTASVRIDVATTIVFSDGITPNGDGLNEYWVIQLIDEFPDANVKIFNRWGQKVFESKRYSDQWNGINNGKKLPVGTYYYLIDLGPNQEKFTGPITLMR